MKRNAVEPILNLSVTLAMKIDNLHFHVKNTIINVVVWTVHNIHESIGNPDSEVANKAGCLAEIQNFKKKYIEMIG